MLGHAPVQVVGRSGVDQCPHAWPVVIPHPGAVDRPAGLTVELNGSERSALVRARTDRQQAEAAQACDVVLAEHGRRKSDMPQATP